MGTFQLRQVSDYVHRPQPTLHYQKEPSSLTGFNMYLSNSVLEIPLLFVLSVLCFLYSVFWFFVLLVFASHMHSNSQSFLSSLAWRVTVQREEG